jgi:hypothetical protein
VSRRALWLTAAVLLVGLIAWSVHRQGSVRPAAVRIGVDGGDGGGLPRARPEDEHIDAAALARVPADAAARGLRALLVMRDRYLVFERYGGGYSADTVIDSGPAAQVLPVLLAGVAVTDRLLPATALIRPDAGALPALIGQAAHQDYARYLSRRLWRRLNAAAAWIEVPSGAASVPAGCCFHARVLDWMRIAALLLDDGRFEGARLEPPGWTAHLLQPPSAAAGMGVEPAAAAQGGEPFEVAGVCFLRGVGRWRLWLVPSLRLAILFDAPAPGPGRGTIPPWDEARLPNRVIRAVSDRGLPGGEPSELRRLVPGH